jgi:molybdate transport system substrate-binding protein
MIFRFITSILAGGIMSGALFAGELTIAVASNFTQPIERLSEAFHQQSGHRAALSFGSTGGLYAQIQHGAPFDVLLSADAITPAKAVREGFGVNGSVFVYALGKLVLWSASPDGVDHEGQVLFSDRFDKIAIADAKLAPYGAAAEEVLARLKLSDRLKPQKVTGTNISQTHQFVASGSVPLGFVALSQVYAEGKLISGSAWIIPETLYSPIRQSAVLLQSAKDNPAAVAFLRYLRSDTAQAIIASYGYGKPER